jgi:c-di-GMP-related signal transduction protein
MMLGYERLKRWLLLLLMTASKDANMQPVMFASFRRGLFMEHLVGEDGGSSDRDEVFILGVLSLIDKLFREPMPVLLDKLHVRDSIREALLDRSGPFTAYLGVDRAVQPGAGEGGHRARIRRGLSAPGARGPPGPSGARAVVRACRHVRPVTLESGP